MIFQAVVSVLLIIVVLLQFGKGAEVGLMSSTGGGDSVFTGIQKGNIFTKITIILSILFMGNSILLAKIQGEKATSSLLDETPIVVPLNSDPPKPPAPKKSSSP